ncbi:MAG: lipopolysaccharide assembly protein LapA domain-containing protein [Desulfobacteraceae bacterium]
MKHLKFILAILVMLVVVILVVQNQDAFSTRLGFRVDLPYLHARSTNITVYYVVTLAFLFGILVAGLYGMVERFRLKKEIRILKKAASEKDAELNSLRNLPLTSEAVTPPETNGANGVPQNG